MHSFLSGDSPEIFHHAFFHPWLHERKIILRVSWIYEFGDKAVVLTEWNCVGISTKTTASPSGFIALGLNA